MKISARQGWSFGMVAAGALALAACGSSDDVSEDAEAESVEITAEEAMEPVTEMPVEDSAVVEQPDEEPAVSEVEEASNAQQGEDAEALAARIRAELGDTGEAAETPAATEQTDQ